MAAKKNKSKKEQFPIVGIGASAGGLKALEGFVQNLPDDTGMAFVIIIHLSPEHQSNMAELLQADTNLEVSQVTERVKIERNHIYVIPPDKYLKVGDGHLAMTERETDKKTLATIDLFFRSLAEHSCKYCVCIVLSGTGSDGSVGLKAVKEQGGVAITQDPYDAEYDGMPRSAINTGLVDLVLPVREMGPKLMEYKDNLSHIKSFDDPSALSDGHMKMLEKIFSKLNSGTGHDFSHYKRSSILRRIERRMQVTRVDSLSKYLDFIEKNPDEIKELFKDLLISVTSFFRDSDAFGALKEEVIPQLFESKQQTDQVRVWVAGCATGEEAYSMAILLQEYARSLDHPPDIQIFASDIDEHALAIAREGKYSENISAELPSGYLQRYFVKEGHGYRVRREIKEHILFAFHDLLKDPPFSKLDLISCRNLLIYLNKDLQSEVFELFHYALRPEAFLFLGLSDSNLEAVQLFSGVSKKYRLYRRSPSVNSQIPHPHVPLWQILDRKKTSGRWKSSDKNEFDFGHLHQLLLSKQYAPPGVLLNENQDVIHSTPGIGEYLNYAEGEPSRNILDMIIPELQRELRSALFQFNQNKKKQTIRKPARLKKGEEKRTIELIVEPVTGPGFPEGFSQVVFNLVEEAKKTTDEIAGVDGEADPTNSEIIEELEHELQYTKEQLQVTIEEYETSNEELRASNEELQSMNEELQSTTEELETSKEELQSVNEELKTVNLELEHKVDRLHHANSDLKNLMEATEIGSLFIDLELNIKLFTSSVTQLFNLIESDIGRPLEHVTHQLDYDGLLEDARYVTNNLEPVKKVVSGGDNLWFVMRLRPYRTTDDELDGVVITFVEITDLKHAEEDLKQQARQHEMVSELGLYALSRGDMQALMDKAVKLICTVMDVEYCLLLELNSEGNKFMLKANSGAPRNGFEATEFETGKQWDAGYAMEKQEPVVVEDYDAEKRFDITPVLAGESIASGLNVIIRDSRIHSGILSIYSASPRSFTENDVNVVQSMANIIGVSIERERESQKLQEEMEQSRKLQRQIIKISTGERWKIGEYLHDNLAQTLVAAKLMLSSLGKRLKEKGEEEDLNKETDKVEQLVGKAADNIRELSHEMIPMDIKDGNLEYVLDHLGGRMQTLYDLECTFSINKVDGTIQSDYAGTSLLRIIQEAAKNAAVHGKATKVDIEMTSKDDHLKLTIQDNGRGLDDEYEEKHGMGIHLMRHRAQLLEGSLNIERVTGKGGTIVTCLIPFKGLKEEE